MAERVREEALYAIKVYKAGDGSDEEEAAKAVVIAIQASVDAKAAEAAFIAAVVELSANHKSPRHESRRVAPGPRAIGRSHAADQAEGANQESRHRSAGQSREPEGWHGRVRRGPV
jgi:hypothetical protein